MKIRIGDIEYEVVSVETSFGPVRLSFGSVFVQAVDQIDREIMDAISSAFALPPEPDFVIESK